MKKIKKIPLLAFENDGLCRVRTMSCQCASFRQVSELEGGFKITHSDTASKLKCLDKCSIYLNFAFEHQLWYQKVSFYIPWVDRMLGKHESPTQCQKHTGHWPGNKTDATVSVMSDPTSAAPKPRSGELLLMQLCPAKK